MYNCVIIGAGIAGLVVARRMADSGKNVLVIEKRKHIGGNCFDYIDDSGILIHKYGPHIFHTDKEEVYSYLSKFTKWYNYHHEVKAYVQNKYLPVPFNLNTLRMIYTEEKSVSIEKKLIDMYGYNNKIGILELMNNKDEDIRNLAVFVYENIFLKYTMKQWGKKPEEIDKSITARVPIVISNQDGYFQDKYQGMPLEGYTKMFENMINSDKIHIRLGADAKDFLEFIDEKIYFQGQEFLGQVVYTGQIDQLMEYEFGRLPYRSLRFEFETHNVASYQPAAVVNYTVSEDYTRITEFKKLTGQIVNNTTIVKEYSYEYTGGESQIPYYAILDKENISLYEKYLDKTKKFKNLHMLGRLAEYKYYNIDAITYEAIKLSDSLLDTAT